MRKHTLRRNISRWAGLIVLGLAGSPVWAASEEIQVYMDEMNEPGKIGLDIHGNYVFSGNAVPDYPGAQAPRHVFRLTPEFSYGLTPELEMGAYILTSRSANGNTAVDGEKLRLKYIKSKSPDQAYFVGANLEVGRVAYRLDENPWNGELKGIFGYDSKRWSFGTNANVDFKISGPTPSPATLNLATKISYKVSPDFEVGAESYNEMGELRNMGHLNQHGQTLYGVIDTKIHGWDINIGLGRGLTSVSDRWTVKTILTVPFS
ncbi:hypothetical protein ACO0K9_24750 [Undibacterium sp. Ji50W]|uniref:hypothetical protein n=1 Tax=Undibacterium sp. Ji50W TaxID=3413041 RepID=UPI003BF3984E